MTGRHLLHHTLATHDWSYQWEIAKKLTCAAVAITSAADAPHQIDYAIRSALREKKPAYIARWIGIIDAFSAIILQFQTAAPVSV